MKCLAPLSWCDQWPWSNCMRALFSWNLFSTHYIWCSTCTIRAVLSEDMVKDGYEKIMNIDISKVLIQVMTIKYKNMPQLQCKPWVSLLLMLDCLISYLGHKLVLVLATFRVLDSCSCCSLIDEGTEAFLWCTTKIWLSLSNLVGMSAVSQSVLVAEY